MKLTWSSPSYLTSQSEIQLFLDHQIPLQHTGEMPQILMFLRTFDGGISPSLIVEPATGLDKWGERCTDGISDGVVAASSIFVYNVVT